MTNSKQKKKTKSMETLLLKNWWDENDSYLSNFCKCDQIL